MTSGDSNISNVAQFCCVHMVAICCYICLPVYQLISRRRFQQMDVLEGQNILVTISGKKNKIRVYYLSWLKSKILKTDGVSNSAEKFPFIALVVTCQRVLSCR